MKIASWNVNSLNVRLPHLQQWLTDFGPDVVGLQETKMEDHKFPEDALLAAGYRTLSIGCEVPVLALLRQDFVATPWWGKRVRLSAWIRTDNVVPREGDFGLVGAAVSGARGAALYLATSDTMGPLYNIEVTGTTEWTYHELVLEIPAGAAMPTGAKYIPMGLSLNGTGQVWVRDLKFEEVSRDTPVSPIPAQGR